MLDGRVAEYCMAEYCLVAAGQLGGAENNSLPAETKDYGAAFDSPVALLMWKSIRVRGDGACAPVRHALSPRQGSENIAASRTMHCRIRRTAILDERRHRRRSSPLARFGGFASRTA
jgi:hypothetical protein